MTARFDKRLITPYPPIRGLRSECFPYKARIFGIIHTYYKQNYVFTSSLYAGRAPMSYTGWKYYLNGNKMGPEFRNMCQNDQGLNHITIQHWTLYLMWYYATSSSRVNDSILSLFFMFFCPSIKNAKWCNSLRLLFKLLGEWKR